MPTTHVIQVNQSLADLCELYGLSPERIWSDPANGELRRKRSDPNRLLAGDEVVIPDKEPKTARVKAGAVHRFRRRGIPARIRIQLLREGAPRSKVPFLLIADGKEIRGSTNHQGILEAWVPNRATSGELRLGAGEDEEVYEVALGGMDPIEEIAGVQKRLLNLGFDCGEIDGRMSDETVAALAEFQEARSLEPTGELDEATRELLAKLSDTEALPEPPSPDLD